MSDGQAQELVVLLDPDGNAIGTEDKAAVHHAHTPLHLAFSCYVFDAEGRLLVSRRALTKRVFPGVWTNSVCGHPAPGETLEDAVNRRAEIELGMRLSDIRIVLPRFAYRAEAQGIVELELCPVVTAHLASAETDPNPTEVDSIDWIPWQEFLDDVLHGRRTVSPWCALQVEALAALGPDPAQWPTGDRHLLPPALQAPAR